MIAVNAAAQIAALGAVIVLQTAYAIIVARALGPEDFGRFTFAFSITQILLIGCDLGLHNTAIRRISLHRGEAAAAQPTEIFSVFFYLKLVLSIVLVLVVIVLSLVLKQTGETRVALVLFGLGMFFHSLNLALNVTFQAYGKLYLGSFNNVLISLSNFGIGIALLAMGGRVVSLGFAYLLATFLAFLLNRRTFEGRIHPIQFVRPRNWQEFALESIPVGLGTLFYTISSKIDVTLLTLLAGSFQTGVYSAAYRVYSALINVPLAIFSAVLPVLASLGKDRQKVRKLFAKTVILMVAISLPLAAGLYLTSSRLVHVIYGEKYRPSGDILEILAWSLIPVFVGMAFSHVILSQAQLVRFLPVATGAAMIVNVGSNVALIPTMGSRGAAVSTLLTEVTLAALYAIVASKVLFVPKDPT